MTPSLVSDNLCNTCMFFADTVELQSSKVGETTESCSMLSFTDNTQQNEATESRLSLTPGQDYTATEDSSTVPTNGDNELVGFTWSDSMQVHFDLGFVN